MSKETLTWLNTMVLVGNTDQRGTAWHWRASRQGEETNHYPGAIPVDDVLRRLFDWQAIELPLLVAIPADVETATTMDAGGQPIRYQPLPGRKAIAASDTFDVLGIFKSGYQPHQYRQWLLENVATILDDNLGISSAGLLKNRAVAWVEISVPESIKTPEDVEFRPNLLACTSFDGSLSTTYKRTVQLTICDNSMSAALGEQGQPIKVRHSKNSHLRITDAREALAVVYETADTFAAEVDRLTNWAVTESQWEQVIEALVPTADSKRGQTVAGDKRLQLGQLYHFDSRVMPWKGTAFGVLQAFNTWSTHQRPTRGGTVKAERAMLEAIDGTSDASDAKVLQALAGVAG